MTGKSVRQLTDEMENGGISAQMVAAAFQAASGPGGRFNGMMDKMSGTMTGLLSTLMDAVSMGLKPIGDAAASVLKPLAKFAIGAAEAFQAFAEKNSDILRVVAMVLLGMVAVGGVLAGLGFAAIAVSTVFGGMATVIGAFAGAISFIFSPLGAALAILAALAVGAGTSVTRLSRCWHRSLVHWSRFARGSCKFGTCFRLRSVRSSRR